MSIQLYEKYPKRLFTFGCSFTDHPWSTWANILGKEFEDVKFYNFGRQGAGNQYIYNTLMQADAVYNFNESDLVIIEWTNVCREDRYLPKEGGWVLPGNIYGEVFYDAQWIKKYFNEYWAVIRDFALIKGAYEMLKGKTQWHFLQIVDLATYLSHGTDEKFDDKKINYLEFKKIYEPVLKHIQPSYLEVLWKNTWEYKIKLDHKLLNKNFKDNHPNLLEHFKYLKKTFTHEWKDTTVDAINKSFTKWKNTMQSISANNPKFKLWEIGLDWHKTLKLELEIRLSDETDNRIQHIHHNCNVIDF